MNVESKCQVKQTSAEKCINFLTTNPSALLELNCFLFEVEVKR